MTVHFRAVHDGAPNVLTVHTLPHAGGRGHGYEVQKTGTVPGWKCNPTGCAYEVRRYSFAVPCMTHDIHRLAGSSHGWYIDSTQFL